MLPCSFPATTVIVACWLLLVPKKPLRPFISTRIILLKKKKKSEKLRACWVPTWYPLKKKSIKLFIVENIHLWDEQCHENHTVVTSFNNYQLTANLVSTLSPVYFCPPVLFSNTAHMSYYFTHKYQYVRLKDNSKETWKILKFSFSYKSCKKQFLWSPFLLLWPFSMETWKHSNVNSNDSDSQAQWLCQCTGGVPRVIQYILASVTVS